MIGWQARLSPTQSRYVSLDVATRQFIPRHVIFFQFGCQRPNEVTFASVALSSLPTSVMSPFEGSGPYANAKHWRQMLRLKMRFYIENVTCIREWPVNTMVFPASHRIASHRLLRDCKTSTKTFKSSLISVSSHAQQREQPKTDPAKTDKRQHDSPG